MRKLIRLHVTCLLNCFIADNGQWRKDSQYVVIIARNAILPRILRLISAVTRLVSAWVFLSFPLDTLQVGNTIFLGVLTLLFY